MSDCDENAVNNEIYNSRNLPSHGHIPKWLEDMSHSVAQSRVSSANLLSQNFPRLKDISSANEYSIPSTVSQLERSFKHKRSPDDKASLTSQIYAKNKNPGIMLSSSEYLVPYLEGNMDFSTLHSNDKQESLEKSWKSLDTFQQTHKGRLDSAKNKVKEKLGQRNMSLPSSSLETDSSSSYSPSFLNKDTPPLRSKSEMSNYVPTYVYSKIKKATEREDSSSTNSLPYSDEVLHPNSFGKAHSSEDIYNYSPDKRNSHPLDEQQKRMIYFQQSVEKHLNEYKLKVDQENKLREKIINELLSENERITERLRKNGRARRKLPKTPSFEDETFQKVYNRNTKYKNKPERKEPETNGVQKDNLIEYYIEGSDFVIPELPTGKILKVNILSTWGDKHYVGLNGIEIFGDNGRIVAVKKVTASPADINVLPEHNNDPRVVTNLLDGVNRTQDDVHLWLAPFDEYSQHAVAMEFRNVSTVAMIRIWNYNKSRIHSFRGVKDVVITLDGVPIFKGEIAKACGGIMGGVDAFGDTILFTTDENILEVISKNDNSFSTLTTTAHLETPVTTERPPTVATMTNRPYTGIPQKSQTDSANSKGQIVLGGSRIDLIFLSNWGYVNIIGLAGLEVVGISDNPIAINENNVSSSSRVSTANLRGLINGENVTTDIANMWWVPFCSGQEISISIQFDDFTYISGLRIWNYNQTPETTYAGARTVKVLLDGKPLMNGATKEDIFLLRRAPGNTHYDFVQEVRFLDTSSTESYVEINNTFNSLSLYHNEMPEGFVFQFIVFSTWGDQYYCGLNEIELYNEYGTKIILEEQNICAYPESINVLPGVNGDIRTPDKLIDGVASDDEGAHSWLAPIIPKCLNRIYIILDQPVTVSLIKLWNYSKTPARGVKEFGVLVDDLLVYNGVLNRYIKKKGSIYSTILFTDDKSILEKEHNTYIRNSTSNQEVILYDESRTTTGGSLPNPDQTLRPYTSVSPIEKGYTSQ